MPEIKVYNYTESKFMRLDAKDLFKGCGRKFQF